MSASFGSLIVAAVLALVYGTHLTLPLPFRQIAPALAGVHSFREVEVLGSSDGTLQLRSDTIFVRHGTSEQTYTVTSIGGRRPSVRLEVVATGARVCERQGSHARWKCQATTRKQQSGANNTSEITAMHELTAHYKWTLAGYRRIHGVACTGYRATSLPGATQNTNATLWIASTSKRPVELRAVTSDTAGSGSTSQTEQVTWSNWDDPSLTVPRV